MIAALGFAAATLSTTVVWPQVWLSCRHGRTRGLSPTGSWLAVGLDLCWLTYGLLVGDAPQIATHTVVGARQHRRPRRPAARPAAAALARGPAAHRRRGAALAALAAGSVVAVVLGAAMAAVAAVLSAAVSLAGVLAALPQLLGILLGRTRDLSGTSPARWYLGAGSCAAWTGYGLLLGQPAVWLSAGAGLLCAVVTCAVLRARRTAPAAGWRPVLVARRALAAA